MTDELVDVTPLLISATDDAGRTWVAASAERWSRGVHVHVYCVTASRPSSHDDVVALDLSWEAITDAGVRRAAAVSAGWLDGVWLVTFAVHDARDVREVRGYRDPAAPPVVTLALSG